MSACSIKVRGIVQGVGFRPFVFRLARANTLAGWVLNGEGGVEIFLEGTEHNLEAFVERLQSTAPPAAQIEEIEVRTSDPVGLHDFTIRESQRLDRPTTRISPDLPVCDDCLRELFDPSDRRYHYPYINCTNCGPRYTIIQRLPYDRRNTTMDQWRIDEFCARQYEDPWNRRFHAQPVACPSCGPGYALLFRGELFRNESGVRRAAELLTTGKIIAMKGLGGYHLACDARNAVAVEALRDRKYRKEKPFALMARNLEAAREIVALGGEAETLLTSVARPIVVCPAKATFPGVAPGSKELGVMLAYTPLQHLLFAAGAPTILVMTSANRSSEPIAYEDEDALDRLRDIADAFLIGERRIARRVDDSVARAGVFGSTVLRRARGYAPSAVTTVPTDRPILALGADLKNTVALVVNGQAFVSQHVGDLNDRQSFHAFEKTIDDLISMYDVRAADLMVAHDRHPQYTATAYAHSLPAAARVAIQHHRAHIASVLAELREWDRLVIGVSLDGTGYGDDGTIWGGELFAGSVREGFERVAHLRPASLPGGDAAAQYPAQAAAGFLAQLEALPDMCSHPFSFSKRYAHAAELVSKGVRSWTTTSMGRLFDTAAALLGFTRGVSFEGQAAIWIEQLARASDVSDAYPFPFDGNELDFRPLLRAILEDRSREREPSQIARSFQRGIARGIADAVLALCKGYQTEVAVLSGGVFQNELLLEDLHAILKTAPVAIWTNHEVPANDGGISLGQAALAAFHRFEREPTEVRHA